MSCTTSRGSRQWRCAALCVKKRAMSQSRQAPEVKAYFTFIGFALLALAGYLFIRRLSTRLHGNATVGRVVGHDSRTDDDAVFYLPIVEFADWRGTVHRFTSVAGRSSRLPAVGATVRICYRPENPSVAYIQSFLHMWAAPLACAVLGAAALAVWWQH
jgi:Protein of unknown function (DUF3592)